MKLSESDDAKVRSFEEYLSSKYSEKKEEEEKEDDPMGKEVFLAFLCWL